MLTPTFISYIALHIFVNTHAFRALWTLPSPGLSGQGSHFIIIDWIVYATHIPKSKLWWIDISFCCVQIYSIINPWKNSSSSKWLRSDISWVSEKFLSHACRTFWKWLDPLYIRYTDYCLQLQVWTYNEPPHPIFNTNQSQSPPTAPAVLPLSQSSFI